MRRILSITGSRADYGLMQPIYAAIAQDPALTLELVVTAMHFLPDFAASLAEVRKDNFGLLHELPLPATTGDGAGMARSIGTAIGAITTVLQNNRPDILLLQGDRGEMLAGAIAGAHLNLPMLHMSGGDVSGSIDDSVRNAISKLAHLHLTNCAESSARLVAMGEAANRILEVGEPGLDQLIRLEPLPRRALEAEFKLPPDQPFLVATLHPVTDEADQAAAQMTTLLQALEQSGLTVVMTHPNSDAGGEAMRAVLESWRDRPFLRIVAHAGSRTYLSLVRHAAAVIGNSSSGIYDTPTLKVPAINIGSRQTGRMRAGNVVDVGFDRAAIAAAIRHVLHDAGFRAALGRCVNPFGDGRAAERTVAVLKALPLGPALIAKWLPHAGAFLPDTIQPPARA
jgi:UDP-N-acetylglucosamine 2-epimerase (non-hydrolysing)/GDP/UDP-N,N'-diacetylbacillosamine 2-epimerase (hydrolysing)